MASKRTPCIRLQRLLLIFIGLIYQPAVDLAEQKRYILWANAAIDLIGNKLNSERDDLSGVTSWLLCDTGPEIEPQIE
jgi:hypothetical protein